MKPTLNKEQKAKIFHTGFSLALLSPEELLPVIEEKIKSFTMGSNSERWKLMLKSLEMGKRERVKKIEVVKEVRLKELKKVKTKTTKERTR